MNLQKEFIPYPEAVELKQLGFAEDSFRYYKNDFKLSRVGLFYKDDWLPENLHHLLAISDKKIVYMTEIIIKIEKSSDGFFWAFSPDEKMITGGGNTIEKCKQDIFDCIETLKEIENPEYLKEYQVIFDVI